MTNIQYQMRPDGGYTVHIGDYIDGKPLTGEFWQKQLAKQHRRVLTAQLTASALAVSSLLELLYIPTH